MARGFRRERRGRDGLAAGWMSGAELAGGFAVVADSRVRVLSIATRWWWDGARVVAGWRAGRATVAERRHGGGRAWHARQAATPSGGGMVPHARVTAWRAMAANGAGCAGVFVSVTGAGFAHDVALTGRCNRFTVECRNGLFIPQRFQTRQGVALKSEQEGIWFELWRQGAAHRNGQRSRPSCFRRIRPVSVFQITAVGKKSASGS